MVFLDYRIAKNPDDSKSKHMMKLGKESIIELLPGNINFDQVTNDGIILFSLENQLIPITQLSDGFRSIIALVGDLIWRLFQTFSHLETDPRQASGIVLIDELDIHLHPVWQRLIAKKLRTVFPNLQFFVATHSPFVAAGAGDDALTLTVKMINGEVQIEAVENIAAYAQNKYNPGKNTKNRINPVKKPLYDMFSGKCAFCERKVEISAGRIEHFKPKSEYIDLTFDWNNFLYACEVCNNAENKGDKFPLDCDGTPLLIDPTDEDCDIYQYLEFYWDEKNQLAHVNGKDGRGQVVKEILSLYRNDLIEHRSGKLKPLLFLFTYAKTGDQKAIEYLIQSCKFDQIRYLFD